MQVRLNSTRGNFETTWRASKKGKLSSLLRTFLALVLVQIGKLTVSQLKFWPKCRRINQSGNKKELLERYTWHPAIVSLHVNFTNNLSSLFL